MLKKGVLTLVALLLGCQLALAKKIVIATDATWPPMESIDATKKIVGYDIDFMTLVAKEAGFQIEFKNTAWDGIFEGLNSGKYDAVVSSVSITEERQKQYDFSIPYFEVSQALVVPISSKAKTLADLKGKAVGAQIGTTGYFAIKKEAGVEAKSYDEIGLAMEDLFNGRIAGAVCDNPTAANFILTNEKYAKKFKVGAILKSDKPEYYGVCMKKGNVETKKLFDKGIKAVMDKGLNKDLKAKWLK